MMEARRGGAVRATYRFTDVFAVRASAPDVAALLDDLAGYPTWWPQVLAVADLGGDRARVLCRSALPYTLDLVLTAVHRGSPLHEVRVEGDLDGWVRVRLSPGTDGTRVEFEQQVEVRGLLAVLSPALRPVLRWNHGRMMAGFAHGLRERLER